MKVSQINLWLLSLTFQYAYSGIDRIAYGDFVSIPFKNKIISGCIWENKSSLKKKNTHKKN